MLALLSPGAPSSHGLTGEIASTSPIEAGSAIIQIMICYRRAAGDISYSQIIDSVHNNPANVYCDRF